MATFSYEVSPYRRGDGTFNVKVRMIHRRKTVRHPSGIYATDRQLTRDKKKIKDAAVLDAVNRHLERLRKVCATIPSDDMTAAELWDAILAKKEAEHGFALDFFDYAEGKVSQMSRGTAEGYRTALASLEAFVGESLDVNDIDAKLITAWRNDIERRNGKGCRAASFYLGCVRHIFNLAREEFNDEDIGIVRIHRQPFRRGVVPPQPVTGHRALTVEQMRGVLAFQPMTERQAIAKDAFLLSFFLMGMNLADIHSLRKDDLVNGVIVYRRRKTYTRRADGAEVRVRVEKEAMSIIARHPGVNGLTDFSDRYGYFKDFVKNVNKGLKDIGETIGVPGLSSYYARHSWATIARNVCKVDWATVHQSLAHAMTGADRVTDIYVERDWSASWEANAKVINSVTGD